jgi:uncharacterized RDD family membrane protein YckC
MRCRYCGSNVPQHEVRCQRCQHRLDDDSGRRFPVVATAAAPDYQHASEEASAPARRLTTVAENPDAPQRPRQAIQPRLFPSEDGRRVVGFEEYAAPPSRPERSRQTDGLRHPKRKPIPGQGAFDFTAPPSAPPSAPLSREISRRTDLPVAGFRFRAMASLFDAGFVFALAGIFLLTIRMCLHTLPAGPVLYGCYAIGTLLIAAAYKLLYCYFGQATLGQQGARLRIVSFDGHAPSRPQRMIRMLSGWVSLASAGMGVVWALFDQERLSWHDHISQTFLTYED